MVLYEALERVTAVPFPLSWAPTPGRVRTCSPSDCHGGLFPCCLADFFLLPWRIVSFFLGGLFPCSP